MAIAARVPVLLWGAPGTGKTSTIRALADAAGLPCETVIASIREPSDFAGLPIVVGQGVRFAPPAWAQRLAAAGRGLLFLDELSTAPPAVQAALLRVVLERVVGDLDLPADIAVVAAANPPEQAADGWDLSAPLANRLCHLAWDINPRVVADGLAGGWAAPQVPELTGGWEAEEILARGLVAAFLRARPALACAPPADPASAGRGWPSPRTWEMAARLWGAAGAAGAGDEVAVVCDTSGSMTDDLLAMALAEVEGLLRSLGMSRQVRVLACDTAAAPAQRVSSSRQVELVGGGGTDMGAGITAAYALRPRPAITVVLTDGYTPWPDRAPKGMRVVVALLGDSSPDAPAWARAVRVPASGSR